MRNAPLDLHARGSLAPLVLLLACGPQVQLETDAADSSGSADSSTTAPESTTTPGTTTAPGTATVPPDPTRGGPDVGGTDTSPPCDPAVSDCTALIDVLFVIDNSGTMGEEQRILARAFPLLIERLETLTDSSGVPIETDVNIMVTTSDFGNPLCTPFQPDGYERARGAPIQSACSTRLQDFTNLTGSFSIPEACLDNCPDPVQPDDPFIHFSSTDDNIPDSVVPTDIDGDGDLDSPAAQALSCIGPQGINGCGYESQLENMLQALNPAAPWNGGARPFMREGALLAIVLVTDEADCSVNDYSTMQNPMFQNVNPNTGMQAASSAICWNAGVTCTGPDANGVFSECHTRDEQDLQLVTRYTNYLIQELRGNQGKEIVMLGILGVPSVTAHSPDPPFTPTAGGMFDLVYRNWRDGQYPVGDILPDEFAMGETAADKQFDFGIGPGCTGIDAAGEPIGQAIPPVRMASVCQALDLGDAPGETRCCIESICDDDYGPAIGCLTGLLGAAVAVGN